MSTEANQPSNPSINASKPVIVFDGICLLCNRWVHFILRHDKNEQFMFASMQSDTGKQLLITHGLNADDPMSFLLVDDQGGYTETDAIVRILTRIGGAWKMAAVLRVVPSYLRNAVYRAVARNRYRWFGKRESCMVPTKDIAWRFIQ